jgi:hypothetical protein
MRLMLYSKYNPAKASSTNKSNFEYMAYGNEKGIAAKIVDGVICVDINPESAAFKSYMATTPKSYKSWRRFKLIPRNNGSFEIEPASPNQPKAREIKITAPAELKNAG